MRVRTELLLVLWVMVAGCDRSTTQSVTETAAKEARVTASQDATVTASLQDSDSDSQPSAPAASEARSKDTRSGDQVTSTAVPAADLPMGTPIRLVLMTAKAPILLELSVMLGNRPAYDVTRETARREIEEADSDGDGKTSWEELVTADLQGLGLRSIRDLASRDMLTQAHDANRNGMVDPDELLQFQIRTRSGAGWLAFRMDAPITDSVEFTALGAWLDVNHDNRLDEYEWNRAVQRLQMRDGNADGRLQPNEYVEPPAPVPMALPSTRRRTEVPVVLMDEDTDWEDLLYRLQMQYAYGSPIYGEDLKAWPPSFERSGKVGEIVSTDSLARVLESDPDLRVTFRLASADASVRGVQVVRRNGAEVLRGLSVRFDSSAGPIRFAVPARPTLRALDFDFDRFDRDDNGVLDHEEFFLVQQAYRLRFKAADANADNAVDPEELTQQLSKIQLANVRLLEMQLFNSRASIANCLDVNDDGVIDADEIHDSSRRLAELDIDGDGVVRANETRKRMTVVVGVASGAPLSPVREADERKSKLASDQPPWFRAMDSNKDGYITPHEFLGDIPLFDQLDVNRDGGLTLQEATAWPSGSAKAVHSP